MLLAWYLVVNLARPYVIADEQYHVNVIRDFLRGNWPPAGYLTMFPGYHLAASAFAWVFGASLWSLRAFSLLCSLAGVIFAERAAQAAATRGTAPSPGRPVSAAMLFALNPLLLPHAVLVYTEALSTPLVLLATWAALRGRHIGGAVALIAAAAVRQDNLAWAILLFVLAATSPARAARSRPPTLAWLYPLVLVGGVGGLLVFNGALTFGQAVEHTGVNPAQFYLLAVFVVGLLLPSWLADAPDVLGVWLLRGARRPLGVLTLVAVLAGLIVAFYNPHPWSQDPHYLANRLLVGLERNVPLRGVVVLATALGAASLFRAALRQPDKAALLTVLITTLLFVGPHSLPGPRGYILPTVLAATFWRAASHSSAWRQVGWYALLAAPVLAYVASRGSPAGGIW